MADTTPHEYSYFRAGGVTAQAIDVVLKARKEVENVRLGLCMYFGAYNLRYTLREGKAEIEYFLFHQGDDIPAGWDSQLREVTGFRALPKEGIADYYTMLSHMGLLTKALRRASLEAFFDIPPMPVLQLAAGDYSQRFVRKKTYVSEFRPYLGMRPEPDDHGNYKEDGNPQGSSPVAATYQQIVTFRDFDNVQYVRVPNDSAGKPLWTPPDSTPVSYNDMLALDFAAYRKAFGAGAQRPRFGV